MTLLYLYIAQLLEETIDTNVKNSIHKPSTEIREQVRDTFETITRKFALYEKMSLAKLQEASAYVAKHPMETNLTILAQSINVNVVDGRYEVCIINSEKVVEKSSLRSDIGLDFKAHPYFSDVLDKLKSGEMAYKVTGPIFDVEAMDIRQYFIVRGKGDYWVEIGHALPFENYGYDSVKALQSVYPSLRDLDIYILTAGNVQYINKRVRRKESFKQSAEASSSNIEMILSELGRKNGSEPLSAAQVAESFEHRDLAYVSDDEKREAAVYVITNSYPGNGADGYMVIVRMLFDQSYYLGEYRGLRNLLYLFTYFILLFAMLSFVLIYKAVIQKVSNIAQQMRSNEPIVIDGYLFSEFRFLVQRYNDVLLRWKEEMRRLQEMAMQDELTKCANRRYFNMRVRQLIDFFQRYGRGFSMIIFDIDDFKKINDRHGHDIGDYILRAIAKDVKEQLRDSDALCRIGGEEFAIILPETGLENAETVAEKIRSAVENHPYLENERVTISLGVDCYRKEHDFNSFYRAVDALLYLSKESGKNCVHTGSAAD